MKTIISFVALSLALVTNLTADVIRKPGIYSSTKKTTTLTVTDSAIAVGRFVHVTSDQRKTQMETVLGAEGEWACVFEGEWSVWIYQKLPPVLRVMTILPPEDEKLHFRTSVRVVSITEETEAIPKEIRSIINEN